MPHKDELGDYVAAYTASRHCARNLDRFLGRAGNGQLDLAAMEFDWACD
ncbi:hypothetical protein MTX26_19310 [Bradyrhizobium sp. ISRA443]|nr:MULTISPECIES: hypothetical protein [unclassified Bradyrhizobium]WGR92285.1 hypothetical protein MTX20_29975 [Bradyrhizobium sp. ISRA435]WGR96612.1 hypothetical protein MTX23_19310 [Bradyrhizobium sp. ISRA436]WGS03499.1 hypothetical protein MTX18_19310 [Bradyrhizobium sp. ISRA437]WGS10383.1 hypothetical protein MTX26_19310 [Bradyrhizobium sp. ISRA443]